jgi:hypothetical protein
MRTLRLILNSFAVGLTALALAPAAQAQATRTWVSGVGDDANPCSRTAPCKTFAGAISKTAVNGLINVLDSAGYGAVTITKSITIDGGGALAGLLASGTNAINVNGAGIKVTLRNLSIEGAGTGLVGINFIQGSQLSVENCRIFGFQAGNATAIRATLTGAAEVMVKDTNITDSGIGIRLDTSAGQLLATLDNVRIENMNTHGVETAGAGQVFMLAKHSTINHNNQDGVRASASGSVINLVDSSFSFNNGTAINASVAGARIRISSNTIVNNNIGLAIAAGATIESAGDNRVAGFNSSAAPNAPFSVQ